MCIKPCSYYLNTVEEVQQMTELNCRYNMEGELFFTCSAARLAATTGVIPPMAGVGILDAMIEFRNDVYRVAILQDGTLTRRRGSRLMRAMHAMSDGRVYARYYGRYLVVVSVRVWAGSPDGWQELN